MIEININSGGLWFLFGIFFFGCLTFNVQTVLRHTAWRRGLRPRTPGGEVA